MPNLPNRYQYSLLKGEQEVQSVGEAGVVEYHECAGGCGEMIRAYQCSPCAEKATLAWMLTRKNRRK